MVVEGIEDRIGLSSFGWTFVTHSSCRDKQYKRSSDGGVGCGGGGGGGDNVESFAFWRLEE